MADELDRRAGHSGSWKAPAHPRPERDSTLSERPLTPVQYAVAILVQHPELVARLDKARLEVPGELKGVRFLADLIDFCREKPNISTALVLEHWRDKPEGRFLSDLAVRDLAGNVDQLEPALEEALDRIHAQLIRSRVGRLQQIQAADGLSEDQNAELRHWLSKREAGKTGSS